MSEYLEPINPLEHITKRDPIPESVMDSSAWFKTETVELDFGEYVGRPNENVTMHTSMLAYYFANGWYVDAVVARGHTGSEDAWKSVAKTKSASNASSSSSASGTSTANSQATVFPGTAISQSQGQSYGNTLSSGSANDSGSAESESEQDGGPYWYAYNRIRLKRRKMQSELVLKDMISSFTKAYNEGREINNSRYDELVALYSILLSRTENEAGKIAQYGAADFKPLADMVIGACKKALEDYQKSVENLPDDWMKSRTDEIVRKFDAMLAQARARAIDNGTYNSSVWTVTESGIERDRQIALTDLSDTMVTLRVDVAGKIATLTEDIGAKLLDCETRVIEAFQKSIIGPTEIRNTVFKWMLDFMERREDDYPGLDSLATIADRLGYGDGATVGPGGST